MRNTAFMRAVGDAQQAFRPDAPGTQLIPEMRASAESAQVVDNQKLSGLAGNDLPQRLAARGIDTVFLTGVATNLTVEQTARHGTDLGLTVHPSATASPRPPKKSTPHPWPTSNSPPRAA